MRTLLTEGSGLTSRQVATRLADLGHEVGVLSSDPIALCRFTRSVRHWHHVPPYGPDPIAWLDAALAAYRAGGYDLLFPTQEQAAVLAWAAEHGRLAGVRTAVPSFRALASVQDKISARETLERLEIPQPESTVVEFDRLGEWDAFPVFVKTPIGTASGGVRRVGSVDELAVLIRDWATEDAVTLDGRVVVQAPVDGPLAMLQTVFDDGRLVAFHANERYRLGARGGASHKRSIADPAANSLMATLGASLGWHGALSADVILGDDGPVVIDVNPRLVEPANAIRAGVDLVAAMVDVALDAHPPAQPAGRTEVRTHQLLLAILGAAEQGRGRRGLAAELWASARRRGDYADSTEELTPVRGDWRSALPVVFAASCTLIRPATWTWFSSGSVANYAISPAGWARLTGSGPRD